MRRKYWGILLILLFSLFGPLFLLSTVTAQEPAITFQEFISDYDEITQNFTTYDVGQKVLIEDTIIHINYDEEEDITKIWFESEGVLRFSKYLTMIGDASAKYKEGEKIGIDIHIYAEDGHENYSTQIDDMYHIKKIEVEEEKHGIDMLGFHIEFPEPIKFLDNNYGRFLIQFLIWVAIGGIVLMILDPVIRKATEKTETKLDDIILGIIRRPVIILIILYGAVVSLRELELPSEFMYWVNGAYSVGFMIMMIWIGFKIFQGVLIQIGHTVAKRTGYQVDKILVPAIMKIGTIIIGFIALGAIMGYLQIDMTLFFAGGVVISMVIAFAAQDTLSNFFSGIFLILEPKFKEGDMIYFEGDTFSVKKIGMRTTVLYDIFKHIDVVMPNNKLANEKLVNITEPDRRIKDSCTIGVAYGSDPQKVQDILMEIVMKHPDIITEDPDRAPFTRFYEFGDSSLNFKVGFWVKDLDDRYRVVSEVNQEIYYRLAKEGIEIPFPQRDLHIINSEAKNNKKEKLPASKKNRLIKKVKKLKK
jgi:small-conductance mechanosensitive channel